MLVFYVGSNSKIIKTTYSSEVSRWQQDAVVSC